MKGGKKKYPKTKKAEDDEEDLIHNKKPKTKKDKKTKKSKTDTSRNDSSISDKTKKKSPGELSEIDITQKLSNSAIYCREDEKSKIINFLKDTKSEVKSLFISGQPGTGKTSLVNEILSKENSKTLSFVTNCMSLIDIKEFYEQFQSYLTKAETDEIIKKNLASKDYKKFKELIKNEEININFNEILNTLKTLNIYLVFDEIDFLYSKADEISFYDLINIPYLSNSNVKMILISNNSDFDKIIFPKLGNRGIKVEKLVFNPYTLKQLFTIMQSKLEDMGLLELFSNDSLKFLSAKMNKMGDLRPIIEIIKSLILKNKESLKDKTKKIELKDMFQLLKQKNFNLGEIIQSMTFEQKIIVASMYYAVEEGNSNEIEEIAIYNKYKEIKTSMVSDQLNIEEFRTAIKALAELGMAEVKEKTKGNKKKSSASATYKMNYTNDDLEIIFLDPMLFGFFNKNNEKDMPQDSSNEEVGLTNKDKKGNEREKEDDKEEDIKDEENSKKDLPKPKRGKSKNPPKKKSSAQDEEDIKDEEGGRVNNITTKTTKNAPKKKKKSEDVSGKNNTGSIDDNVDMSNLDDDRDDSKNNRGKSQNKGRNKSKEPSTKPGKRGKSQKRK